MKFEIKYTWDSKLVAQRLKCLFRHDWDNRQGVWTTENGLTIVMAFKVCKRCAKSKLIHILV